MHRLERHFSARRDPASSGSPSVKQPIAVIGRTVRDAGSVVAKIAEIETTNCMRKDPTQIRNSARY